MNAMPSQSGPDRADWESLRLLNSYRAFVAIVLATGFLAIPDALSFGRQNAAVFLSATGFYAVLALVFAEGLRRRRPGFLTQCNIHFYTDIIALGVMLHASGGVTSGLGILMVVPVAAAGTLLQLRYSLVYAALATLLLLTSEMIRHLDAGLAATAYTPAALLGVAMFASALLAGLYARRHAQSIALARQRSVELRRLERLNERVIEQMEAGILVVAPDNRITQANASARVLLGNSRDLTGRELAGFSRRLNDAVLAHRQTGKTPVGSLSIGPDREGAQRVQVQFTDLGDQGTLVVLEDAAFIENQVQQMKLASLGRLTAGIAHEVRNPLTAIAHSAQLLAESDLEPGLARMVEIQLENCRRINAIVEGILQVSRRGQGAHEQIELVQWLQDFVTEFRGQHGLDEGEMTFEHEPRTCAGRFQPEQLRQVLVNLCGNCLQHGRTGTDDGVAIRVRLARDTSGQPIVDVLDNGVPIAQETLDDIFEPFYTTSHTGTGLGLYLARELCELNDGNLQYIHRPNGNCLRITLPAGKEE